MTPDTDALLLAELRSPDPRARADAEERLFADYHHLVTRLLTRILGPDVDDCLQEVFMDVFRGLATFEGRARLSTWIYRVALRRAWKCAAGRRRGERGRTDDPDLVEATPDPRADVGGQLAEAELAKRFESALARLDMDQRTVLALAALDGLGPTELAEVLGLPVGTVHSRLARARERMRELLGIEG